MSHSSSAGPVGWDHPDTARYYEAFCEAHGRYREANAVLAELAWLSRGHSVLDVAAGTGRTAQEVLLWLGPEGRITCFEPALAMRTAGQARIFDARVSWTSCWPAAHARFDRILCGAAIWQLLPIGEAMQAMASLLAPGGMLCFNIPSLYLGQADQPGGGSDPNLFELPARVAGGRLPSAPAGEVLSAEAIEGALEAAGCQWLRWRHQSRMTQRALRDWLKIPVLTDALWPDLEADVRARRIDAAFDQMDADSWRWESWTGWTAWRTRQAGGLSY